MEVLGGGESVLLSKLSSFERRGGGIDDAYKTMRDLDREYPSDYKWSFDIARAADYCGLKRGCVKRYPLKEAVQAQAQNLGANPGPSFKAYGFEKKSESIALAMDIAATIEDMAKSGPVLGEFKPKYALAGRTKCQEKSKFATKGALLKPFGRAVFMFYCSTS